MSIFEFMKVHKLFLLLALSCAIVSVSCAKVNTPAFTERIEKAVILKEYSATYGAFVIKPEPVYLTGMVQPIYAVEKIHWSVDETFYAFRYRAKLSDAVEEINAPPDKRETYIDIPFKIGWDS
jgi:hypothetical protein